MKKLLLTAALAGVACAAAAPAFAADKDKCFGIAKAGKNDCAAADGSHSCAGHAKTDNASAEWKYASKEECAKEGGKMEAPTDIKEKH